MADRLATLLGTKSTELLVAQDGIRSIGKFADMLVSEFDQQASEAYPSSDSEGFDACRMQRMPKTGSLITSPVHATNSNSAKQSPEVNKSPCRVFPQAGGGSPPIVKRNCNIELCQSRREACKRW